MMPEYDTASGEATAALMVVLRNAGFSASIISSTTRKLATESVSTFSTNRHTALSNDLSDQGLSTHEHDCLIR